MTTRLYVPVFILGISLSVISVGLITRYTQNVDVPINIIHNKSTFPDLSGADNVWIVRQGLHGGSAFPVRRNESRVLFLTAAHVISHEADGTMITIQRGTQRYLAAVSFRDDSRDIALLSVTTSDEMPLFELSESVPVFGSPLYAAGYFMLEHLYVTAGLASAPGLMSAHCAPGCSGGPVLDQSGSVVGLITGVFLHGTDALTYASVYTLTKEIAGWVTLMEQAAPRGN